MPQPGSSKSCFNALVVLIHLLTILTRYLLTYGIYTIICLEVGGRGGRPSIRTWSLPPSVFRCVVGSLSALAFLHSPCTCLSCTSLFALHSVLTLHSAFFVCFLRTSLRRMSFEMIGLGIPPLPPTLILSFLFSSLFSHRF